MFKKLLILLGFFVVVMFLTGCSSTYPPQVPANHPANTRATSAPPHKASQVFMPRDPVPDASPPEMKKNNAKR